MRRVPVRLGARSYEVLVGRGLLARLEVLAPILAGRRVLVASDDVVWPLYGPALEEALAAIGVVVGGRVTVPAGEVHKTLASVELFWQGLLEAGIERRGAVVALGGGVVGDVAGFAAATYLRGVDVVQVPTTLLAMVDSSVGGKTGIDLPAGKNLVGAFHQPRAVVADLATLTTLPRREVLSGLAEVIKAALVGDAELFGVLEARGPGMIDDPDALEEAVSRAVALKARVVEADEKEGGARALLNLGHTLGHAVEAAAGYGAWTHGEAVALGIGFSARLSRHLGLLSASDEARLRGFLGDWGYPQRAEGLGVGEVLARLGVDKKSEGGAPRWVVLRAIGTAEWGVRVPPSVIETLLSEVQEGR